MGKKSGFTATELAQICKLYVKEGRSYSQIAKILGKGTETSVRNALVKAKIRRGTEESGKLELFRPGQTFGEITLIKQLIKSKKLKYHVSCSCGYEFDIDPYLLTLANNHKDQVSCCVRCRTVAWNGNIWLNQSAQELMIMQRDTQRDESTHWWCCISTGKHPNQSLHSCIEANHVVQLSRPIWEKIKNERGLKCLSIPSEQQLEFHGRHPERAPLFLSSDGLEGMERSREETDDQPGRPLVDDHSQRREHLGLSGQQQHWSNARCAMETRRGHDLQSQHANKKILIFYMNTGE